MTDDLWPPIVGSAGVGLVALGALAFATRYRAMRTDKTALLWFLAVPAVAHLWGEFGGAGHAWLEFALGIVPWYAVLFARLFQLDDHACCGKRMAAVAAPLHLGACLLFVVAAVRDPVSFEPVVLALACVPPCAFAIVLGMRGKFRLTGHVRDALALVTAAAWVVHLAPGARPLLAFVHPLALVRIALPTKRPEHEQWFLRVDELSDAAFLGFLSVARAYADPQRCDDLASAWRAVHVWRRAKAKHVLRSEYDRLEREALEAFGQQAETGRAPETVAYEIRLAVHTEFGALLRKPRVQFALRDWIRARSGGRAPDAQELMLEDMAAYSSDAETVVPMAPLTALPSLPPSDSESSSSSSTESTEGEVIYVGLRDFKSPGEEEEDAAAGLKRSNSVLERLARERGEFMANSQAW